MTFVSTYKIIHDVISCADSLNTEVQNARDTVLSWMVANDAFRTKNVLLPDNVIAARAVLRQFIKHPDLYPDYAGFSYE